MSTFVCALMMVVAFWLVVLLPLYGKAKDMRKQIEGEQNRD